MGQVGNEAIAFLSVPGLVGAGSRQEPQLGRDPGPVLATEHQENGSHCTTAAP